MSNKELRERAHRTVDETSDDRLPHLAGLLEGLQKVSDQELSRVVTLFKEVLQAGDAAFEARVKRIIEENRDLLQRLAQ